MDRIRININGAPCTAENAALFCAMDEDFYPVMDNQRLITVDLEGITVEVGQRVDVEVPDWGFRCTMEVAVILPVYGHIDFVQRPGMSQEQTKRREVDERDTTD